MELTVGALDAKVAVVSGASSGSGLGVARRFGSEGAHIAISPVGRLASTMLHLARRA